MEVALCYKAESCIKYITGIQYTLLKTYVRTRNNRLK